MARVRRIAVVRPLLAVVLLTAVAAAQVPGYSREVRPILAEKCFRCHGPDGDARRAGLRLDLPGAGDLLGRERGDELLRRIAAGDPEVAMPPPESGKTLTTPERDTLERWIAGGGRYERHWAFVPPERPAVPEPPDGAANDHPIDAFVRARLAAVGLEPSPEADRATLVRRVWLDLVGLPPTPAEAAAFVDDPRPDAYERLVDALLASPHYGERQARRWLDLARYADSNGYEKDRERSIWPYRDWVIRALDADMPFDEFAVKQIAGDMLPDPTPDDWIATGFHRNTMLNEEGGIDPLEYRFHALTDRVATTGTAFLGLTLGCAQCHTHKFDPITHREYFGLLAYFDDADEPDYAIPDAAADERERDARRRAEAALEQLWDEWPGGAARRDEAFASWLAAQRKKAVAWTPAHVLRASANVPTLLVDDPGSGEVFATGDTTKHDVYRLELAGGQRPVTAIRLEALPDARLPAGGPGLTYYEGRKGDFFLGEFVVTAGSGDGAAPVAIARASASYWKNQFGNSPVDAGRAIDGDLQTGWSTHGRHGQREVAVFVPAEPIAAALPIAIELHFGRHFASSLGRFRVSFTDAAGGAEALALPFDADGALEASLRTEATATDPTSLRPAFLLSADEVKDRGNEIRGWLSRDEHATTLILRERPPGRGRVTHRRHRGEFLQPREEVAPHLPEIFGTDPAPTDRLGFARWLVSPQNPLTARVIVNRQWAAFFGRGLVATLDDFGAQGALPSHPQLLDWLAVEFVARGWSQKQLQRLIVTSATYRQSSRLRPRDLELDPDNRWLARAPRFRLEAEILRDAALVASGTLVAERFGPPVRPPQPEGVTEIAFGKPKWHASAGPARYRRSIYTFQKRTAPFAFHVTFDAPSGESCTALRQVSNTPLQALTLLNDPMLVELAHAFGDDLAAVAAARGAAAAVDLGFRRVLTRAPDDAELASLTAFVERQRPRVDERSAWAALARALLCLDEAQTRN